MKEQTEITKQAAATLVEADDYSGAYDMRCTYALIDTAKHGRLLIVEGFGGMDSLSGGAYRWRHGEAYRVAADATLEGLREADSAYRGGDGTRLGDYTHGPEAAGEVWPGAAIAALAKAAGL